MRKIYKLFAVVLSLMIALVGCAQSNDADKTYDDAFLKDLKKGLTQRWDMDVKEGEEQDDYYGRMVQAEIDCIEEYSAKKFADTKLQEKAISYINCLKVQKEALSYYSVDIQKYNEMWGEAYDERTKLIKSFIEEYGVEFSGKYADTVDELLTNAKIATENDEFEKKVDALIDSIEFNKVKTEYSYSYYEAIVENTTDKTFDNFSLDINLLDKDGVIIETTYASVSNFAPGQKAKLEFMTDKNFAKYELTEDYYVNE